MNTIYLHGFASSPNSTKARYLGDRFTEVGVTIVTPDLNQGDFSHLTLTRQIQQVEALLTDEPTLLIGSSLGGLISAWVAERNLQVQQLVLLAPAFEFLANWSAKLGASTLQQWQRTGVLPVYHYSEQQELPLHYEFMTDAAQYNDAALQRPVPTLILHGVQDDVVPIAASYTYAATRPWVQVQPLDSDHSLGNVLPEIWQAIAPYSSPQTSPSASP